MTLRLVIPGPPQGQGRPRIGRGPGGRPMAFTPAATRTYAQLVQGEWIAAGRPSLPAGPFQLSVWARFERPASHVGTRGLTAVGRRAPFPGKPDLDNIVKGVLDALCAVGALPDDRHLVDLVAWKRWATPVAPFVGVEIEARALAVVDEAAAA